MPAHLLSLTDGPSILIDKPILLFGRHQECDVQLNSKKVSRRHCCIAQVNDYLVVRDLGSTNGIRINGQRVTEGRLQPGDELVIGNFRYQVCGDVIGRPVAQPPSRSKEKKRG
jgi:pSer/pThr/pTyr-binding forkhead associated (FHA) protein